MTTPNKKIPSIINSFKSCYDDGQGCKGCGATTSNSCYQCSSNPDICVCEASEPLRSKCRGGGWVKQKPPTTTEMEMMTEQVSLVSMTQREKCGWGCLGDSIANPLYVFTDEYKDCQARCDREELGRRGPTPTPEM